VEPEPAPAPPSASGELTSPTLAELYFKQGFPDKAIEVYRELVEREPENDRLRRRLAELEDAPPADVPMAAPQAAPSAHPAATRRVALERTIAKLEGMLAAIKKG
jgi:pentatricopeptide repeat protein